MDRVDCPLVIGSPITESLQGSDALRMLCHGMDSLQPVSKRCMLKYLVCPSAYYNTTFHGVGGGMQQATPVVRTPGGLKGDDEASTPRFHVHGLPTVFAKLTIPSSPGSYTMDPGTAIAISSLCAKVVSIIGKYYLDVQDAKSNIALLAHEVQTFGHVV